MNTEIIEIAVKLPDCNYDSLICIRQQLCKENPSEF